jgi:hypothetical protein
VVREGRVFNHPPLHVELTFLHAELTASCRSASNMCTQNAYCNIALLNNKLEMGTLAAPGHCPGPRWTFGQG